MPSATDTHRQTIEAAIETAAILAKERVEWPGMVGFDPPAGGNWMRVNTLYGDAFEDTMDGASGSNVVVGVLEFQLFGPEGEGYGPLFALGDKARDAVNMVDLTGPIRFGPVSPPKRVANRDAWLQVNVTAPFEVDETV